MVEQGCLTYFAHTFQIKEMTHAVQDEQSINRNKTIQTKFDQGSLLKDFLLMRIVGFFELWYALQKGAIPYLPPSYKTYDAVKNRFNQELCVLLTAYWDCIAQFIADAQSI